MDIFDPFQKLIAAARGIPEDDRVPYAFEHRVMARIRALGTVDPLAWWGASLSRAAALCVLVTLLLSAVVLLFPAQPKAVSLPDAVQGVLLATVDNGTDQIRIHTLSTWKVILATLVIFATGLVVGGLVVNRMAGENVELANPNPRPQRLMDANPGQMRLQSLLRRMDHELALTKDQNNQIHSIISESQQRTGDLWKPVAQQVNKETQDACEKIRAVLTPEQQAKFDAFATNRPPDFGERGERGWRRPPGQFPGGSSNRNFNNFTNGPRRGSGSNFPH